MFRRVPLLALVLCGCAAVPGVDAGTPDAGRAVHFRKVTLTGDFLSEGAAFADFDRDDAGDVVSGPYWYAGPDFTRREALYPPQVFSPLGYSDNFFSFPWDFNADGWPDVLTVGFPGQAAAWLENPHDGGFWPRHLVLDTVDGESPAFTDFTGDGTPELVCAHGGQFGFVGPSGFVAASAPQGLGAFTHGMGTGDLDGDGRVDLLEAKGVWLQRDAGWTFEAHDFGPGGAQMFVDGKGDVFATLEAHGYGVAHFERLTDGGYAKHLLDSTLHEPHALAQVDLNGDGREDLVTGERFWGHVPAEKGDGGGPARLVWFERVSDAGWLAHQLDDQSGVGTQLWTGDVNGDGRVDLVTANKKGAFVFVQD